MRFVGPPLVRAEMSIRSSASDNALKARGHEVIVSSGALRRHCAEGGAGVRRDRLCRGVRRSLETPGHLAPAPWAAAGARIGHDQIARRRAPRELHEPGRTVFVGHSLSFSTRVFEEVHRVPAATIHLAPSIFRSDYAQPAYAPGLDGSSWPRWLKRSIWWSIDRFMLDQVAPDLNEWRRELGLPPVTRVFRDWIHSPQRVIGLFPDWFGVPQSDWPASLR